MTLAVLLECVATLSAVLWLVVLLLPWQPWRNDHVLRVEPAPSSADLSDTTVVIPARNEAAILPRTLQALARQGTGLRVVVVDDGSTDGTAQAAQRQPGLTLQVIEGRPLPTGWAGKVWALAQGVAHVTTPLTLLLDADVALGPGVVVALKEQMRRGPYHFVSVMASLHMRSFWEKLLMPSFIYFFKMLYPFRLARSSSRHFYAAAGGCIMLETRLFRAIGGLDSICSELIDDCALARRVKAAGFRTWIGQSLFVSSIRPYAGLGEIWRMVARSAFTQLRYSALILLLTSAAIIVLFVIPPLAVASAREPIYQTGLLAWVLMAASYLPTLRFYGLSPLWVALMPLTGGLYLGMTWSSAIAYWRGQRSTWKGRVYR